MTFIAFPKEIELDTYTRGRAKFSSTQCSAYNFHNFGGKPCVFPWLAFVWHERSKDTDYYDYAPSFLPSPSA